MFIIVLIVVFSFLGLKAFTDNGAKGVPSPPTPLSRPAAVTICLPPRHLVAPPSRIFVSQKTQFASESRLSSLPASQATIGLARG